LIPLQLFIHIKIHYGFVRKTADSTGSADGKVIGLQFNVAMV